MKNRLMLLILVCMAFSCDQNGEKRKIRLAENQSTLGRNQQLSTTIYLEPKERRSVAVMFFQNLTGDENLHWLQTGISEMLIRALSQSQNLSVLSSERLFEILNRPGEDIPKIEKFSLDMAAIVAREAKVEAVLTGDITKNGDSLRINVKLIEPQQGILMKEESVEGPGLEAIFGMVDHLTQRIKSDLQLSFDRNQAQKGIADISTHSLDAWRYYTAGVELWNQLLFIASGEQFLKAIEIDSTFIAAYLRMYWVYYVIGDVENRTKTLDKLKNLKNKASPRELYEIKYREAVSLNDIQEMLRIGEEWIANFPEDVTVYQELGNLYFGMQNYQKAISYYEKGYALSPLNKIALNQMSYSYAFLGQFSKSLTILKKYQAIAPNEPNPYDTMGEIYYYMGDYKNAEKQFRRALKENENFISSLAYLGNIELDCGDNIRALHSFETLLEKASYDQRALNAYRDIARTYGKMGQKERAFENYRKLLFESANKNILTIDHMFDLLIQQHDSATVRASLEKLYDELKTEASNDEVLTLLAFMSVHYDIRISESIDLLNEYIDKIENNLMSARLRFALILLYQKTGQKDAIRRLWKKADDVNFIFILKEMKNIGYISILRYYGMINRSYYVSLSEGIRQYQELIVLAQEYKSKTIEMVFRLLLSDLYDQAGDAEASKQERLLTGAPDERDWMIIGPFENNNGFNVKYPPEKKLRYDQTYKGKYPGLIWKPHGDDVRDGYINFKKSIGDANWAVSYGSIDLISPDERDIQFRIGSNESVLLWLNGEEIWKFNRERDAIFDNDIIHVRVKKGINHILIKVCNRTGEWGFYFRATDENGDGMKDMKFVSPAS